MGSLADICQQYNLNVPRVLRGLSDLNIKAKPKMAIKKIAEKNKVRPIDIYEDIKNIINDKKPKPMSGDRKS